MPDFAVQNAWTRHLQLFEHSPFNEAKPFYSDAFKLTEKKAPLLSRAHVQRGDEGSVNATQDSPPHCYFAAYLQAKASLSLSLSLSVSLSSVCRMQKILLLQYHFRCAWCSGTKALSPFSVGSSPASLSSPCSPTSPSPSPSPTPSS